MKRTGMIIVLISITLTAFSQAKPAFSQYILNNYILNPAISGIENYTDIRGSYRQQWQGIDGAPVTTYFSAHTAIGKTDFNTSPTSYEVPGNNPRGEEYWRAYTSPDPHHGAGLMVINDQAGYINRWSVTASYAYHQPLGTQATLAGGFNAGISSVNVNRSRVNWGTSDPNDPALGYASGELQKLTPEISAGLFLYSNKYFVGFSVLNIVPVKIKFTAQVKYGSYYTPNYFLTSGYRIQLNNNLSLLPSVMFQYWQPQLMGAHINAKLQYQDLLWLGAGIRYGDIMAGYSAMAGFYAGNSFNVSYAYEAAGNGRTRTYAGNTHEILLGFTIGNKYGNSCPKNIW